MPELFSIGEMSKIHDVPIKTLRYYDEIGLFVPYEINEETGYRYYAYNQFEQLNTIKFLKYLGVPLKEIKGYLKLRDKEAYLKLLAKEKLIIEEKMAVYSKMLASIEGQMVEVQQADNATVEVCEVKHIPSRQVLRFESRIQDQRDLELALHKLKKEAYGALPIVIGMVGLTINRANLLVGDYDKFDSVFILLEHDSELDEAQLSFAYELPGGEHACINYRGDDHLNSPMYYGKLMAYIEENDYEPVGDAVERVIINAYKSQIQDEHLTEIQVPVKKLRIQ